MARQPEVLLNDNPLSNVLEIAFGIECIIDADGVPTGHRRMLGIEMRRVADDGVELADWATSADHQNRLSGTVNFYDAAGRVLKSLTWDRGYLSEYDIYQRDGHVEERFVIMSRALELSSDEGQATFELGDLWWRS